MSAKLSKKTKISSLIIIVLIPLVIWFGITFLSKKSYYLVSVMMIILAMTPFFIAFEKKKPHVREVVIIATLSGIAVAGRVAFIGIPQFKPVVAIVIISGVCFGGHNGFLVGALAGFVSNFYMGQGPWTPWQMFCFGIVGFLAGVLFEKGLLKKKTIPLCIYGGLSTLLLYGGIINLSGLLYFKNITMKMVVSYYMMSLPMDLVHAASTVIFLLFISKIMIEKLDRIKIKYGLLE